MSSTDNFSLCDRKVSEFLAEYKRSETRRRYEDLAKFTISECEELRKSMVVKGVVQGRTKHYESLEKKLRDMRYDSKFRDWVTTDGNDICKHPEMGDLAGVRIGLYLPSDVLKVANEIESRFSVEHHFGTVTGGRDATQGRNLDIQKHGNGPWRSQDVDGADEHWEHYGYKSWQVVVEWTNPPIKGLNSARAEIQVGTMVTQAWAEVQHNVIYKRPANMLATPSMKRMIDAVNGLAITTEIMLKELERSLEIAEKEAEEQGRRALSSKEFLDWFQSTYMRQMRPEERQRWVCSREQTQMLFALWLSSGKKAPKLCPINFSKLIEKKRLLQTRTEMDQPLDISLLLREAISWIKDTDNFEFGFPRLDEEKCDWIEWGPHDNPYSLCQDFSLIELYSYRGE